jgi:hypothetical protein
MGDYGDYGGYDAIDGGNGDKEDDRVTPPKEGGYAMDRTPPKEGGYDEAPNPEQQKIEIGIMIEDFAQFDEDKMKDAIADASGIAKTDLLDLDVKFVLTTSLSFTESILADDVASAVVTTFSVPASAVTVSPASDDRRLADEGKRKLQQSNWDVVIETDDKAEAAELQTLTADTNAAAEGLKAALADQGIEISSISMDPWEATVEVETSRTAGGSGDIVINQSVLREAATEMGGTLDTVSASGTTQDVAPAPTPAPAPAAAPSADGAHPVAFAKALMLVAAGTGWLAFTA